jgi:putative tryptophan/tyrosine transport system substrate-binding protein
MGRKMRPTYPYMEEAAMTRRMLGLLVTFVFGLLVAPLAAEAQPVGKVWRIAFLGDASATARAAYTLEPLRDGLRELGYVEGQNIIVEVRWTNGQPERLPELAAELVRLKVDVIVTHGVAATRAVKTATTDIPIVVAVAADMVGAGLIASLARPGGNVTGTSDQVPDVSGQVMQWLREILPGLNRVAVLWNRMHPGAARISETTQTAAHELGLQVRTLGVRSPDEIAEALEAAAEGRADAVIVVHDPFMIQHRTQVAQVALEKRLPAVSAMGMLTEAGGLMSYGPDNPGFFKRAAVFVDKILKGAKPADLPVEQPMTFELAINLKTAQVLGLTIPPTLLFYADKIIR